LPRLSFESIVKIWMAAAGQCVRASKKVGGQEERSPRFVLPHVHALVRARQFQGVGVPAKDHVSQRHGVGASSQRSERSEGSLEQRAVRFDNAVHNCHLSTSKQGQCDREADDRRRAGPEIAENAIHQLIISESRPGLTVQHDERADRLAGLKSCATDAVLRYRTLPVAG
jgi:hypothetical protein